MPRPLHSTPPAKPPSIEPIIIHPSNPSITTLYTFNVTTNNLIIRCNALPRATRKRRYGPVFKGSLRSIFTPLAYLERWLTAPDGSVLWYIQNISKAGEPFLAGSRCCSCYGRYRSRAFGVPIRVQSTRRSPVSTCIDETYRHEESNCAPRAATGHVHKRDAEHIIQHSSATFTRSTILRFG